MSTFPATLPKPSIGSGGEVHKAQVRTPFEGGYVQSRAKYTRTRKRFSLRWKALTEAQFEILENFFDANQGGSFNYAFLGTGDYRFSSDEFAWIWNGTRRAVDVEVEEV